MAQLNKRKNTQLLKNLFIYIIFIKLEHGQGNAPCHDGFADHAVRLLGHRANGLSGNLSISVRSFKIPKSSVISLLFTVVVEKL